MKMTNLRAAFTLIERLVVISIIAILQLAPGEMAWPGQDISLKLPRP